MLLIGLFVIGVTFFVLCVGLATEKRGAGSAFFGVVAIGFFIAVAFAANDLGFGHVPDRVEDYGRRLDNGTAYRLACSAEAGKDRVLLVGYGDSLFKAIRVSKEQSLPPERFALVDGMIVAIGVPVVAEKK